MCRIINFVLCEKSQICFICVHLGNYCTNKVIIQRSIKFYLYIFKRYWHFFNHNVNALTQNDVNCCCF